MFDDHPELQSFSWRQHWHDDEEDFGGFDVHGEADINGIDGWDLEGRRGPEPECKLQPHVAEFLYGFDAEDMEAMFGNSVRVTVYRDGTVAVEDD